MSDSSQPLIVAVIGSRTATNCYALLARELDELSARTPITSLVSGGAVGADKLAERYAEERNLLFKLFCPAMLSTGAARTQ